jgi:5-methylcytosine-specific restriction endonuclease McrA
MFGNKERKIIKGIEGRVPFLIKRLSKKKLEKKLGFEQIDFSDSYFPKYTMQYISAGGNSSMKAEVIFNLDNLEKFINYLAEDIKWRKSVEGQRALMTPKLREFIKERDNYTCCICHNSTEKEPNLLLEIDHITPLSKGGMTEVNNLQTLCWKCNRSKGAKVPYNFPSSCLLSL